MEEGTSIPPDAGGGGKSSFADILGKFKPLSPSLMETEHHYFSKEGSPAVSFSANDIARGKQTLQTIVIMKFQSARPTLQEICDDITKYWGIPGEFVVGHMDFRHVMIRFDNEEALSKALVRERNQIRGLLFRISSYNSNFTVKKDSHQVLVWVELHKLPWFFFDESNLRTIGHSFALKYLGADKGTTKLANPNCARICVLLDISKPLPRRIWINDAESKGFWQTIHYPREPLYYSLCCLQSHSLANCWVQHPEIKTMKKAVNSETIETKTRNLKAVQDDEGFTIVGGRGKRVFRFVANYKEIKREVDESSKGSKLEIRGNFDANQDDRKESERKNVEKDVIPGFEEVNMGDAILKGESFYANKLDKCKIDVEDRVFDPILEGINKEGTGVEAEENSLKIDDAKSTGIPDYNRKDDVCVGGKTGEAHDTKNDTYLHPPSNSKSYPNKNKASEEMGSHADSP